MAKKLTYKAIKKVVIYSKVGVYDLTEDQSQDVLKKLHGLGHTKEIAEQSVD